MCALSTQFHVSFKDFTVRCGIYSYIDDAKETKALPPSEEEVKAAEVDSPASPSPSQKKKRSKKQTDAEADDSSASTPPDDVANSDEPDKETNGDDPSTSSKQFSIGMYFSLSRSISVTMSNERADTGVFISHSVLHRKGTT